ncbi:bifunctional riboflavin kinase/FAD synthetase [Zhaonella formicivorans]|uniref:bifunctional riboflavin kinase/FAD synthetase n=1 Tax=Zhaonella formicivorans TaxID=2528593 RepID=UPI001D113741|nr:bifunctional riboflavin kinase/FAD synthetase [Zhaonella formicivorans]
MDILHQLPVSCEKSVVALGNFDGIHLGHRKLIAGVVEKAKQTNCSSVVLTFDPHPEQVLFPERPLKLLLSNKKKSELIAQLGVRKLVYLPFDLKLAQLSPEEFVRQVLVQGLNVKSVFVGFNYTFGRKASGTTETLSKLGRELGFELQVIPPVKVKGEIVSSTSIREALEKGRVEKARELLGYWPVLSGRVVSGQQKGRTIGFPTANLQVDDNILIPKNGVYASLVKLGNKRYYGMTNIGKKPTLAEDLPITIEINIFGFSRDIYGEELEVSFCHRLRDEQKFASLYDLKAQLDMDYKKSTAILHSLENITTHISTDS